MPDVRLVMFDLAGAIVHDEGYVTRCLYRAACDTGLDTDEEVIGRSSTRTQFVPSSGKALLYLAAALTSLVSDAVSQHRV